MEAIFVYEDWPRSGMPVTEHLLGRGFRVFGYDGTEVASNHEAFDFNKHQRTIRGVKL